MARKGYTEEFKREAVRLYLSSGKGLREIGKELGVDFTSLHKWVHEFAGKEDLTQTEREELRFLRGEVRTLRQEREILKKAAAFFAKESGYTS